MTKNPIAASNPAQTSDNTASYGNQKNNIMEDLKRLAVRLGTTGPVKVLPTPRQVQLLFNHHFILRTTQARYVWEHPYYPQFYVPRSELLQHSKEQHDSSSLQIEEGEAFHSDEGKCVGTQWSLHVGDRSIEKVVAFSDDLTGPAECLKGLVKIDFASVDQWFEESTPIYVHPKDPFKRIDILQSQRRVQVSIEGVQIADTSTSMHLWETGLPCRYYMPLTAIDAAVLRKSETRTQCPYKGEAEYYSVEVGGKTYEDVVWYYNRPTLECGLIVGLACFYNEKVDITLDGEKQAGPDTHFGKSKPGVKPSAI